MECAIGYYGRERCINTYYEKSVRHSNKVNLSVIHFMKKTQFTSSCGLGRALGVGAALAPGSAKLSSATAVFLT